MRHLTLEKLPCSTQLNYFRKTIYPVVNIYRPYIFSRAWFWGQGSRLRAVSLFLQI